PFDLEEAAAPVLASGTGKGLSDHEAMEQLAGEIPEIFRRAQRANVAVYPIDPSGPGGMEEYIRPRLKLSGPDALALAHKKANIMLDFVTSVATETGGHAVTNTNDYSAGITQVFRENSSYYLLGFQPTNTKADGKLRRVQVKVNRPDVEVRAR